MRSRRPGASVHVMDATAKPPLNTADSPLVPARAPQLRPYRFPRDSARAAAFRSAQVRRRKRDKRLQAIAERRLLKTLGPQQAQILRIETRLKEIEEEMHGADPDVKAKLASAHAKLFAAWQTLTLTPRPPAARMRGRPAPQSFPTPEPAQVAQVTPAPEPAPEPAPAPIVSDTPQYVVGPEPDSGP